MGTKYSSQSPSGYNASPPADDGSTADSNKVKWSTHITKLGTPLYNWISAIDTALASFADVGPSSKSSAYTTVAEDHLKTIEVTGDTEITLGSAASMGAGYTTTVKNAGSGTVTVSTSDTIDGSAADRILPPNAKLTVQVNSAAGAYLDTAKAIPLGCLLYKTSNTAGLVTATWTDVSFDTATTEAYDTAACHTAGQNYIVVPGWATYMRINGCLSFAGHATGERLAQVVTSAGADLSPTCIASMSALANALIDNRLHFDTGWRSVAADAEYKVQGYQNSGGNRALQANDTWMAVEFK